jgi:hypothetical protein
MTTTWRFVGVPVTWWRGVLLDTRTADMMDEVVRLCGPDVIIRPTQGSYAGGGVQASAGTHDGGGALDLAGQDAGMTGAMRNTIRDAQRQVGFASWVRSPSQSDWPWHIHAEAVQPGGKYDQGCLSSGAAGQVVDYYEGRNGLASGAPDDGPRDWVGVTWETYGGRDLAPSATPFAPEGADMLVGQDQSNGKIYLISGNTKLEFPGGGDGNAPGGSTYAAALLDMVAQAYPEGPAPQLVALNPDLVGRIPTRQSGGMADDNPYT